MNRRPLIQSQTGNIYDISQGRVLERAEVLDSLTTSNTLPQITYNYSLIENPPPGVVDAVEHYGIDLMSRLAWLLLGPKKVIDVVSLTTSNAGKSTLAEWVRRAFPGGVAVLDAYNELKAQEFGQLRAAMAENMVVFLDEADKIDTAPPISRINELTADSITVNRKNQQTRQAPRKANAVLLGAGWPDDILTGQGADTRFGWAWNPDTPAMPEGLRDKLMTDDAATWLATWMIETASHLTGDASTFATRHWASELRTETLDPLDGHHVQSVLVP